MDINTHCEPEKKNFKSTKKKFQNKNEDPVH